MPSLPRIRRTRTARGTGQVVARPAPLVHELSASGLTWVNVVAPDTETAQTLAERFGLFAPWAEEIKPMSPAWRAVQAADGSLAEAAE